MKSDISLLSIRTSRLGWIASAVALCTLAPSVAMAAQPTGLLVPVATPTNFRLASATANSALAAAALMSISVSPASTSIPVGSTQQYRATGIYSDGTTQDMTNLISWSCSKKSVASISTSGLVRAKKAGVTEIRATSGTLIGSATLTVTSAVLVSITIAPPSASILTGSTQQFTATGTYDNGTTKNLTTSVTWTSSNTAVATIAASGLAAGITAGSSAIRAASGSVSGSALLTVTNPVLTSIAVAPASASILTGSTQQFTATGTYDNGTTRNLTTSVTWTSSNTGVATIASSGLAAGIAVGNTTIQAASGSVSGSSSLTVASLALQSLAITPDKAQVAADATLQLTATGTYVDSSTQDLTSQVAWGVDDATVASITTFGRVTGVSLGTTTIHAMIDSISVSIPLTVTPSGLVAWWAFNEGAGTLVADSSGNGYNATLYNGVSWTAGQTGGAISANGINQYMATPSINLSSTRAFTLATWIDRSWSNSETAVLMESSDNFNNVTDAFSFMVDDSLNCGIPSAIYTGVRGDAGYALNCYAPPANSGWHHFAVIYDKSQTGNKQVSLFLDGVSQAPVATPSSVTNTNTFGVKPLYSFSRGGTQFFTNGSLSDLRLYNRALTPAEIGQIYGLGGTSAALQSLDITPASSTILPGYTQQFTASGTYTDSSTRNLTSSVAWSSSIPEVAGISSSGLATAITPGSTSIQAASQPITASASLTVASTPLATARFVQWTAGDGGATTIETTRFADNVTPGNLILIFAHWDNQAVTATITDQLGNTYRPIFPPTNAGIKDRFQVWYAKNVAGGVSLSITIHFSSATTSFSVLDAMEYSGIDRNSPLDGFTSNTGIGTSQSSGSITVANPNSEIVIGLFGYSSYALPYTAGPGFTLRNYDASTILEDQAAVLAGTYTATATSHNSANWAAFAMGFRNAPQ